MPKVLTRRDFLARAAAGLVGCALASMGCGTQTQGSNGTGRTTLNLWYWNRSIDDNILAQVNERFPKANLVPQKIGGDYRSKLLITFAGKSYVPDIAGINVDIATYFPDADQFVDLQSVGANEVKSEYLEWKWLQGVTPEGKMIGFPMDIGPIALFYREDILRKAGVPTDPDQLYERIKTWEEYFELGEFLKSKLPQRVSLADEITQIFQHVMAQGADWYQDKSGHFIGDQAHVKRAWDLAVTAHRKGLLANSARYSTDWNASADTGRFITFHGAVWMKLILKDAAPDTTGLWRVCPAPGGAGNSGGSFLSITRYCKDPQLAFDIISWVQNPENQLKAYVEIDLYPSTPSIYNRPEMNHPEEFFGGQNTNPIFSESARQVKPFYLGTEYNIINPIYAKELTNVATQGKDPERAWEDALHEIQKRLQLRGVWK